MTPEKRKNFYCIGVSLPLYGINRFSNLFKSLPYIGTIFRNHFNDYLGAIIFMAFVNLLMISNRKPAFKTFPWMLFWGSICSVAWEGITPMFLPYSTADWLDCVAYYLGTVTYWILNKKDISKTT